MSEGKFHRDASNRLCFEISNLKAKDYWALREDIVKEYGLIPIGATITSPDVIFQKYFKGLKNISIEWDHWCGFIVVAENKRAEGIVKEIGTFVNSNVGG